MTLKLILQLWQKLHNSPRKLWTVGLILVVFLLPLCVGVGGTVAAAATAAGSHDPGVQTQTQQSDISPVSVETTYDSTTASQLIQVVMTVTASDTSLKNVRIQTTAGQDTVIDPNSYRVQGTPGIEVEPQGDGQFQIAQLNPGESVTIEFEVVPETFTQRSPQAATIDVTYVRYGQQVSEASQPTADLTRNPWQRTQELQNQLTQAQQKIQQQQRGFVGGIAFGIIALVIAVGVEYRRRGDRDAFESTIRDDVTDAYAKLSPSEQPALEPLIRRLGISDQLPDTQQQTRPTPASTSTPTPSEPRGERETTGGGTGDTTTEPDSEDGTTPSFDREDLA